MSRLLQDHHSIQPRSDSSAVCRLLHSSLPADGRKSSPDRRMLFQEKTALAGCTGEKENLMDVRRRCQRCNVGKRKGDNGNKSCEAVCVKEVTGPAGIPQTPNIF